MIKCVQAKHDNTFAQVPVMIDILFTVHKHKVNNTKFVELAVSEIDNLSGFCLSLFVLWNDALLRNIKMGAV
jgi:hypothetical protein